MRVTLSQYLSFGPNPKKADLTDVDVIVNLRNRTDTSHWYESEFKGTVISFPIPFGQSVFKDESHKVKDKDISVKKLCGKIVKHIEDAKETVYIHGHECCGIIALACWYWLERRPDFDPVAEVRKLGDFVTGKDREQRAQLEAVKEYADGISRWKKMTKRK
jgi:hypothetical protein